MDIQGHFQEVRGPGCSVLEALALTPAAGWRPTACVEGKSDEKEKVFQQEVSERPPLGSKPPEAWMLFLGEALTLCSHVTQVSPQQRPFTRGFWFSGNANVKIWWNHSICQLAFNVQNFGGLVCLQSLKKKKNCNGAKFDRFSVSKNQTVLQREVSVSKVVTDVRYRSVGAQLVQVGVTASQCFHFLSSWCFLYSILCTVRYTWGAANCIQKILFGCYSSVQMFHFFPPNISVMSGHKLL